MTKRILARAEKAEVKRKDDNVETIKKRFNVYNESTMPIVNIFDDEQKCVKIEAIGEIDEIFANVKGEFVKRLNL